MERRFHACYLLSSVSSPKYTYIGFTVNPARRIRQHNGEITCGAFRTKKRRPWQMVLCVYGFTTQKQALKFEWAWQHPMKSKYLRKARKKNLLKGPMGDLSGKMKILYALLSARKWRRQKLTVHFFSTKFLSERKGCLPLPERMELEVGSMDQLPDSANSFEDEDQERAPSGSDASESSSSDDDDSSSSEDELSSSGLWEKSNLEAGDEQVEPVKTGRAKRARRAKVSSDERKQKKLKPTAGRLDQNEKTSRKRARGLKKVSRVSTEEEDRGKETSRNKATIKRSSGLKASSRVIDDPGVEDSSSLVANGNESFTPEAQSTRFMELQASGPRTDLELGSNFFMRTPNPVKPSLVQKQSPYLILSSSPQPSLFPEVSFMSPCQRFPAISEEQCVEKPTPMSIIFISSRREIIDIADSPL